MVVAIEWPIARGDRHFSGEARDLRLLGRQLGEGFDSAFTRVLASRQELSRGTLRECLKAHFDEHVVGSSKLLPSLQPPAPAAQRFAVKQMSASELCPNARTREPNDCLAI